MGSSYPGRVKGITSTGSAQLRGSVMLGNAANVGLLDD